MGFFNSAGGSAISAGASLIGGSMANSANKAAATLSYRRMLEFDGTKYQRAVADLKKADLNPMLAYGGMSSSAPNVPTPKMEDVVTPAVNSAVQGATIAKIKADTAAALATAGNQSAQERVNTANAVSQEGSNLFTYGDPFEYGSSGSFGSGDPPIRNLAILNFKSKLQDMDLTSAQTRLQNEVIHEVMPRIENMRQQGKSYSANAELSRANARLSDAGLPKIQAEAELYRALPNLLGSLPFVGSAINSAGSAKKIFTRGR